MGALDALGINLSYLSAQILNFIILMLIMSFWIYNPIIDMLQKRRDTIAKGIEDARIASKARENAEKDAEVIMAEAQTKSSDVVRQASQRAEDAGRDIKAGAEADIAKIRADAVADAEQERNRILGEVRGQVAALAMAATQKLIGEALTEKRQRDLIDEFFSGVKSGKVNVLAGEKVAGDSAVVTSALPLTKQEEAAVQKDVLATLGSKKATVTFQVDPSILGGLVVRVGDKVLDGSVSGQLESMRQNLR